ncbi:MAG: hypothetical protein IT281_04880 [Ignavibacteria bacterium]|nr:hypothetical protein [Ignavibacteria bacterium]
MPHKNRFYTDRVVRETNRRIATIKNHYKLTDSFNFGKHKNKTIEEVIECDPEYIQWALDSIAHFALDAEAKQIWNNRMLAIEGEEVE